MKWTIHTPQVCNTQGVASPGDRLTCQSTYSIATQPVAKIAWETFCLKTNCTKLVFRWHLNQMKAFWSSHYRITTRENWIDSQQCHSILHRLIRQSKILINPLKYVCVPSWGHKINMVSTEIDHGHIQEVVTEKNISHLHSWRTRHENIVLSGKKLVENCFYH